MSTRAQVRFVKREAGVSFNEHTSDIRAQFYVHKDGYPEGTGIDIAKSLLDGITLMDWEIDYLHTQRNDIDYIYYIWQDKHKDTWISIFDVQQEISERIDSACIFVGEPLSLLKKWAFEYATIDTIKLVTN